MAAIDKAEQTRNDALRWLALALEAMSYYRQARDFIASLGLGGGDEDDLLTDDQAIELLASDSAKLIAHAQRLKAKYGGFGPDAPPLDPNAPGD